MSKLKSKWRYLITGCVLFLFLFISLLIAREEIEITLPVGVRKTKTHLNEVRAGKATLKLNPNIQCPAVRDVQATLNALLYAVLPDYAPIREHGRFDAQTARAISQFREWYNAKAAKKLTQDQGKTWNQLDQKTLDKVYLAHAREIIARPLNQDDAAWAQYAIALDLFQQHEYEDAAQEFRTFLKKYPESVLAPYARNHLGLALYRDLAYEEAVQVFETIAAQAKGKKAKEAQLYIKKCRKRLEAFQK